VLTLAAAVPLAAGCAGSGVPGPVGIDLGRDACRHCRMAIVSKATAAEIVAPGEEPLLFDDIGCLRDFVTDHRSGEWIDARHAVFTRTSLQTPMGSGIVAHADTASRDQEPAARSGSVVSAGSILR
jgi:copper chaperone NosL